MEENVKKIVFTFALVATMWLCSATSISAWEGSFHFRTISFAGDTFTQLLGINDSEMIAGYHGAAVNQGFVLTLPNNFSAENFPNSSQTQVIGINVAIHHHIHSESSVPKEARKGLAHERKKTLDRRSYPVHSRYCRAHGLDRTDFGAS